MGRLFNREHERHWGGGYGGTPSSVSLAFSADSRDQRRFYDRHSDTPPRSRTPSTSSDSEISQYSKHSRRPSPSPARNPRATGTFRASSPPRRRRSFAIADKSEFGSTALSKRPSASTDSEDSRLKRPRRWRFGRPKRNKGATGTSRASIWSTAIGASAGSPHRRQSCCGTSLGSLTKSMNPSANNYRGPHSENANDILPKPNEKVPRISFVSRASNAGHSLASFANALWPLGNDIQAEIHELESRLLEEGKPEGSGPPFDKTHPNPSQGGRRG
jgi:hypothetical protein